MPITSVNTANNYWVACPKFGHSALSLEIYYYALKKEFVADRDMLRKNKITIQKLKQFQN